VVEVRAPYNQEIQQDSPANSQVQIGYPAPVRAPYAGAQQQAAVSGHAAAGVHQPTGSPSHQAQQLPAQRTVYASTLPSAMVQAQPSSAPISSYTQPTVSLRPFFVMPLDSDLCCLQHKTILQIIRE